MASKRDFLKVITSLEKIYPLPKHMTFESLFLQKSFFLSEVLTHKKFSLKKEKISEGKNIEIKEGIYEYEISTSGSYLFFSKIVSNVVSKIKVIVKKGVKLDLSFLCNNPNLFLEVELILEKNVTCKCIQHLYAFSYLKSISTVNENSIYTLDSAYFLKEVIAYLDNSSVQNGEHSSSNIKVSGGLIENSKITNDGIITILNLAKNSSGKQNLKNLILDSTSSVSSQPVLEVYNNYVECSHGATTSKLLNDEIYFLKSRGLNLKDINHLFLESFFITPLDSIKNDLIVNTLKKEYTVNLS